VNEDEEEKKGPGALFVSRVMNYFETEHQERMNKVVEVQTLRDKILAKRKGEDGRGR